MKPTSSWVIIGVFLTGCVTKPQAPATKPGQSARVYYQGTGAEHDAKRFGKFLDIALDDNGLVRVDSAANADAVVKVQFEETKEMSSLYAPVLWITFVSPKGEEFVAKSCNSVSSGDSVFRDPIKSIDYVKFPVTWKKVHENFAIYIDKSAHKDLSELVKVVTEGLVEQHYSLVNNRLEADAELKSIVMQKFSVPERTIVHSHSYEIVDKESGRFSSGTGNSTTYLGLEESVNVKNLPCGTTMASYGNVGGLDSLWSSASDIAKTIHEHISK
jgi:hypothetical protein